MLTCLSIAGAGIVKEVGADIKNVKPGDKVILSYSPCGECINCQQKITAHCEHNRARMWSGLRPDGSFTLKDTEDKHVYGTFFGQSSFSRLALVHGNCIVKVPPETDLALFAPLGCGIQTGAGVAWNALDVQHGESLVVAGCGAVGMSAIMAAKQRGASVIIAVDIKENRLTLAKELGATHAFLGGDDIVGRIHAVCPLPHGVRYAFDTTGVPQVIEAMISATGIRGRTVLVGATPMEQQISFQPLQFLSMGKQLVGSVEGESYPQDAIPYLLEQYKQGNLPLEKVVKRYRSRDFAQAFEDMATGKTIKPVLVWDDF
jgi:Zn-dependent alcohol dehydrogenase